MSLSVVLSLLLIAVDLVFVVRRYRHLLRFYGVLMSAQARGEIEVSRIKGILFVLVIGGIILAIIGAALVARGKDAASKIQSDNFGG